jgi:hypothetical protein
MSKKVIEKLKDIQAQLSDLMKDQQLQEISVGSNLPDPTHPLGHCDLTKAIQTRKLQKVPVGPAQPDPTHPNGHCYLTKAIQTRNDFVDALDKIHQWIEYMIKVLK